MVTSAQAFDARNVSMALRLHLLAALRAGRHVSDGIIIETLFPAASNCSLTATSPLLLSAQTLAAAGWLAEGHTHDEVARGIERGARVRPSLPAVTARGRITTARESSSVDLMDVGRCKALPEASCAGGEPPYAYGSLWVPLTTRHEVSHRSDTQSGGESTWRSACGVVLGS